MDLITQSGAPAGRVGQGTWYLGEHPDTFAQECSALRAGIEAGMTLIDSAEMYGEGAAEHLVGQAIRGYDRERLYLVSKVYPFHAGRHDIFKAAKTRCAGWARTIWTCTCCTGAGRCRWPRRWPAWRS